MARIVTAVFRRLWVLALLLLPVTAALASGEHEGEEHGCQVTGTVTASFPNDPGYEGLWKYTIQLDYWENQGEFNSEDDDSRGFRLFLDLGNCPCICHPGIFFFPPQPGQHEDDHHASSATTGVGILSGGEDEECGYFGSFHCQGAPDGCHITGPFLEFSTGDDEECDDDDEGSRTFIFYSVFAPAPESQHLIFNSDDGDDDDLDGQFEDHDDEDDGHCEGELTGNLPICDCALPVEAATWGAIKARLQN